jgi:hypothetical protein
MTLSELRQFWLVMAIRMRNVDSEGISMEGSWPYCYTIADLIELIDLIEDGHLGYLLTRLGVKLFTSTGELQSVTYRRA